MRVTGKQILADDTIKIPSDQLKAPQNEQEDQGTGVVRLEREYQINNLSYGDRLRMVSQDGKLIDVIMMPDGTVAIQNLKMKIEYGQTTKYNTWKEADQVTNGFDTETAIRASKK